MKSLTQHITEKLVLKSNSKVRKPETIDEPSITIPENAFKETKDINLSGVKFTYDLTILACDVEDPNGERFNLLDKDESDNYYDSYENIVAEEAAKEGIYDPISKEYTKWN